MVLSNGTIRQSIVKRLGQGVRALAAADAGHTFPLRYRDCVPTPVVERWECLDAYDRNHLINVAADLEQEERQPELVLAGLLHDIGKPAHASTVARALAVLIQPAGSKADTVIRNLTVWPPLVSTVQALLDHPAVGASFLAERQFPDRVVWLVRHHHEHISDPDLMALRRADQRN